MLKGLLDSIDRFLTGGLSLRELERWLLSSLQGILDSGDQGVIDVANRIDADFMELSEGLISETELRERLESYLFLATTIRRTFSEREEVANSSLTTTGETIRRRVEIAPVVSLQVEHAFR